MDRYTFPTYWLRKISMVHMIVTTCNSLYLLYILVVTIPNRRIEKIIK